MKKDDELNIEKYVQDYVKQQIDEHEQRFSIYGKLWTVLTITILFILLTPIYIKLFL